MPDDSYLDLPLGPDAGRPDREPVSDDAPAAPGLTGEAELRIGPQLGRRKPAKPPDAPPPPWKPVKPPARGGRRWLLVLLAIALPLAGLAGYFLRGNPPVMTLSSDLLDFGDVLLGEAGSVLTLEVRNQGERALEIESLVVRGDQAPEFEVVRDECRGAEIPAASACAVDVRFTPAADGIRKAELRLVGNSPNSPQNLPLIGQGVAPRLRFEPEELDFGEQVVGIKSRAFAVWLANVGSAPVRVRKVKALGPGAADFATSSDRCQGQTLAPQARCAVQVAFVPTAEGDRRATLTAESDARGAPPEGTPGTRLFGRGQPQEPSLRLVPDRLDFAPRPIGDASPPSQVTLTNDGTGLLTVKELAVDGKEGGFRVSGRCPPLAPGKSCTVEVVFEPAREGAVRAFLEIRHDAGEGLHRVALVGTGTEPEPRFEPDRILFGEVAVHATGTPVVLRVANDGSGDLQVRDLRLAGTDARSVSLADDACSGATLEPHAECTVSLLFAPLRDGPHRAELVIRHNAGAGMDRLPLTGIGIAARLRVDVSRLDFGDVRVGTARALGMNLSNAGRAPLAIRRVRVGGQAHDFEIGADGCSGKSLAAGQSCGVEVRFAPAATGPRRGSLELDHDLADGPREVALAGNGTPPPQPDIRLDTTRLDFGDVPVGASRILEVEIRNPGSGPLELRNLSFTGPDFGDFSVAPVSCRDSVAPGASCRVGVRFSPAAPGLRDGVLLIRHNAAGGTHSVELLGSASEPAAPPPP